MRSNSGRQFGRATITYAVLADEEIGFRVEETFEHPGSQQVSMSKGLGVAPNYDGSGGWARIYSLVTSSNTSVGSKRRFAQVGYIQNANVRSTLPASTLPGNISSALKD
ncbi:uncharacterized protein BDR25DRAFT_383917 [Lindgomyces ingoldianus]|uniref:Uncharacterized protein n=1 Tax=Lindgomyces ingoldianus TaxID=673940 RepID=A0ACB6R688_9PLEO|nr:uncharacterized protein BDR25DRAFT_383917 [Lindgomyces ingoldianus]KAF2474587.1 hypothetical protein BDR25DRAFT_383917 [Lindgomyces ingoldianus]